MGKRSTARRLSMQALYESEHGRTEISDSIEHVLEEQNASDETKEFVKHLATNAWDKREVADEIMKKYSKGWSVDRIGGVDKNIIRLAIYELIEGKTPYQIVINEALELAKKYSSSEASKFINGILGAYIKDVKPSK